MMSSCEKHERHTQMANLHILFFEAFFSRRWCKESNVEHTITVVSCHRYDSLCVYPLSCEKTPLFEFVLGAKTKHVPIFYAILAQRFLVIRQD